MGMAEHGSPEVAEPDSEGAGEGARRPPPPAQDEWEAGVSTMLGTAGMG